MPAPDQAIILKHLEALVAPAIGTALSDGLIEIAHGQVKPTKAHLFPLGELDQAVAYAARVNAANQHVWVGAALRRPETPIGRRAGKVAFYGSFWAWLDDASDWARAATEAADCPPDIIICTGTVPTWRGQYCWRLTSPVTDASDLESLNRGIRNRLHGEDVCDASRLIRLAGSVNYATKPGRTTPEVVTFRWSNGAASATDPEVARRVYAGAPRVAPSRVASPRNVVGQVDIEKAILEAQRPNKWHATVRDLVAHLVGRKTPDDMVRAICRRCTQNGTWSDQHEQELTKLIGGAHEKFGEDTFDRVDKPVEPEPPMPLLRELPPPAEFPVDALGTLLGDAARGIADIVQVPIAMAGCSVLGAAALATQAHVDVVLPTEQSRPTSLYLLSIAVTGDRKSACDREALKPVRQHERNLRELFEKQLPGWKDRHELWKSAREKIIKGKGNDIQKQADLAALGPEPVRPLDPVLTGSEPTVEGLVKLFGRGQPAVGIFSAEGGLFAGSHSMGKEHRLATAAAYSEFWDGEVFKRIRASEDTLILSGRRVSAHLMCQPGVASMLLADPLLADQGLLSRILASAPTSLVGTRLWHECEAESDRAISAYKSDLLTILEDPPPLEPGKINELAPRELRLSQGARALWIKFADQTERRMAAGGEYESVRGLANKLPEHASRLAAVLAVIAQPRISEIAEEQLEAGIELAEYFAAEALRLHGVANDQPELLIAERTLEWLRKQPGPVSLRDLMRTGPKTIRTRKAAAQIMDELEKHGHLQRGPNGRTWTLVPS